MATNNQYCLEKILESLRELREELKQASLKTNQKLDRKVLICGFTKAEDCLCEATNSLNSSYQDINDEDNMDLDFGEEESHQISLQIQQNGGLIVPEIEDHEDILAEIKNLSSSDNQVRIQSVHGVIDANKEEFHVASKVFDEIPEPMGYIVTLNLNQPMYNDSGGVGFPSGLKWSSMPKFDYVAGTKGRGSMAPTTEDSSGSSKKVNEARKQYGKNGQNMDVSALAELVAPGDTVGATLLVCLLRKLVEEGGQEDNIISVLNIITATVEIFTAISDQLCLHEIVIAIQNLYYHSRNFSSLEIFKNTLKLIFRILMTADG